MNAKLYTQVEMAFWDFFIYTLSESKFVRSLIRTTAQFMSKWSLALALIAIVSTAFIGLFSGMIIYCLAFLFN